MGGATIKVTLRAQESLPGGWVVTVWRDVADDATHAEIDGNAFGDLPPAEAREIATTLLAAAARAEELAAEFDRRASLIRAAEST